MEELYNKLTNLVSDKWGKYVEDLEDQVAEDWGDDSHIFEEVVEATADVYQALVKLQDILENLQ